MVQNTLTTANLLKEIEKLKEENLYLRYSDTIKTCTINSQDFSLFSLDRQYNYTYFNEAHAASMKTLFEADINIGDHFPSIQKDDIQKQELITLLNLAASGERVKITTLADKSLDNLRHFEILFAPIMLEHAVIGISICAVDITDMQETSKELNRHQNELEEIITNRNKKLKESEEKFRKLSETSSAGIFIHNGETFEYFNESIIKTTGFLESDLKAMAFIDLIYPDDRAMVADYWTRRNAGEIMPKSYECRIRKKDGGFIWADISAKLMSINGKNALIGTAFEITERKIAEDLLIKAKEKAEESDRLKISFIQNMSHEIRTPLNSIVGFSHLLNQPNITPEKSNNFTDRIIKSSNQLLSVVNDILTISSLETGIEKTFIEFVPINYMMDELYHFYSPKTETREISIYLKKNLSDKLSTIKTDKSKLYSILTNLINNAIKFTNKGFLEFGYELKNETLEFFVKDTGMGIRPELHEIIFERFRQVECIPNEKYALSGLGLGLAISKAYVDLLGGKMWLESEVGYGTTFYFTLPYRPDDSEETKIMLQQEQDIQTQNKLNTILIVEDEENNFLYISELLYKRKTLRIIHARNGKEAIDICTNEPDINLVIMDIKIPIIDGYEATKLIKQQLPNLPIIAYTAFAHREDEKKAIDNGFDDFLSKPVIQSRLDTIIEKFILN